MSDSSAFMSGQRVNHRSFGPGKVMGCQKANGVVRVRFESGLEPLVRAEDLRPIATVPSAAPAGFTLVDGEDFFDGPEATSVERGAWTISTSWSPREGLLIWPETGYAPFGGHDPQLTPRQALAMGQALVKMARDLMWMERPLTRSSSVGDLVEVAAQHGVTPSEIVARWASEDH